MSRLTRQEIKRDEVRDSLVTAVEFVRDHAKTLLLGAGGVVLLVLLVVGAVAWNRGREREASERLSAAVLALGAPVQEIGATPDDPDSPSFATAAERDARARELLGALAADHGGTRAAAVAQLLLGRVLVRAGEVEEGRALWQEAVERGGDTLLASEIRLNLMELDRSSGRAGELETELENMLEAVDAALPEDVILYQLALTRESLGDEDGARQAYQRLLDEHQGSPYQTAARAAVGTGQSAPVNFQLPGS